MLDPAVTYDDYVESTPEMVETRQRLEAYLKQLKLLLLKQLKCSFVMLRMPSSGNGPSQHPLHGPLLKVCAVGLEKYKAEFDSGMLRILPSKTEVFWDGEPVESAAIVSASGPEGILERLTSGQLDELRALAEPAAAEAGSLTDEQRVAQQNRRAELSFLRRIRHRLSFPVVLDKGKIGLIVCVSFADESAFDDSMLPWIWLVSQAFLSRHLIGVSGISPEDREQHISFLRCASCLPLLSTVDYKTACHLFTRLTCSGHGLGWHHAFLLSRSAVTQKTSLPAAFGALSGKSWTRDLAISSLFGTSAEITSDPLLDELGSDLVGELRAKDDSAHHVTENSDEELLLTWNGVKEGEEPTVWEWAQKGLILPQPHSLSQPHAHAEPLQFLPELRFETPGEVKQFVLPMLDKNLSFCLVTSLMFGHPAEPSNALRTFTAQISACAAKLLRRQAEVRATDASEGRSFLLESWHQTQAELKDISTEFGWRYYTDREFVRLQGQRIWEPIEPAGESAVRPTESAIN